MTVLALGQAVRVPIETGGRRQWMTGRVVYLHPEGRYATVEIDLSIPGVQPGERCHRTIRESYPLYPARARLCSSLEPERTHERWMRRD